MLLKRDEVDSNLKKKRGSGVVEDINDKVKECFGVEDEELSQEMGRCLKDVIKDTIDKRLHSPKIMSFCFEKMKTSLDDVLLTVRNLLTQESNLSCTYVDALFRSLVEYPEYNNFLIWSNLKVPNILLVTKFWSLGNINLFIMHYFWGLSSIY
ncbi:hypothetical protein MFLAVUS_007848 [Mucor flavus]|uniref:Uncharacterized protein n=1 Tax=Mucor flavus TaxID=439312 RepID=A0ABP9Z5I2_9FUNG